MFSWLQREFDIIMNVFYWRWNHKCLFVCLFFYFAPLIFTHTQISLCTYFTKRSLFYHTFKKCCPCCGLTLTLTRRAHPPFFTALKALHCTCEKQDEPCSNFGHYCLCILSLCTFAICKPLCTCFWVCSLLCAWCFVVPHCDQPYGTNCLVPHLYAFVWMTAGIIA